MHIITQTRLREFGKRFPDADRSLRAWERIMNAKRYRTPHEVKADFPSADFLKSGKTVFNSGGNKYRLVVLMMYEWGKVLVRHVLTHKEYDKLSD
jgi:mRNA interferase HigB